MKKTWKLMLLLLVPMVFGWSCKDSDELTTPAFETLKTYLTSQNMELANVMTYSDGTTSYGFVTGAPADAAAVPAFVAKFHIIDLRSAADFANGHIEGAINVPFADILTKAAEATKPILVVCYTGQTATYATGLLRLYGFPKTQALKWGMSGWNSTLDRITANVGSPAKNHANWSFDAPPTPVKYKAPAINVTSIEGVDILKDRVRAVVAEGPKTVSGNDVLTNPSGFFVNNFFSQADWTSFGHIKGAFRINPINFTEETILNLDPDRKVVTYCYTGQTSAIITAYLRVLGYDAYSMTFGMNGLYHESAAWATNRWGATDKPKDLPVVK